MTDSLCFLCYFHPCLSRQKVYGANVVDVDVKSYARLFLEEVT